MTVQCACCRGRKVMKTLGGMTGECIHCRGVGYVKGAAASVIPVPDAEAFIPDTVVKIGKRKRKAGG